jgi:hypothetical protein
MTTPVTRRIITQIELPISDSAKNARGVASWHPNVREIGVECLCLCGIDRTMGTDTVNSGSAGAALAAHKGHYLSSLAIRLDVS